MSFSHRGGVGGCWLLVIGYWLLVVGYWLLVVGYWLLVIGCWLLVVGYWLLVVGCSEGKSTVGIYILTNNRQPTTNNNLQCTHSGKIVFHIASLDNLLPLLATDGRFEVVPECAELA